MTEKNYKEHIDFSPLFVKQITQAPTEIKAAFRETLEFFLENPTHAALRNHSRTERYAGTYSIDVTGDWRALYRKERGRIIFVELGTHDQLYR